MGRERATAVLRDPGTSAVAILRAIEIVVGDILEWEPESTWLELERQRIDLPLESRAKAMAGQALKLVPAFYWDAIVFEKTTTSLDGLPPVPDILEEATPAQMAWAVTEAAMISEPREFLHEPAAYAGVVLARAGFALAPSQLAFAQDVLDAHRPRDGLRAVVEGRWGRVDKGRLDRLPLSETIEDVQIARLAAVELHVRERAAAARRELDWLA